MKHKHAELIKAWADGAEIEYYSLSLENWKITKCPSWDIHTDYRIKPEPKPDIELFARVYDYDDGIAYLTHAITTKGYGFNLKLIFDGETGELKSAEVIK